MLCMKFMDSLLLYIHDEAGCIDLHNTKLRLDSVLVKLGYARLD